MIVRLQGSTFKLNLYWFVPFVLFVMCELLLAERYKLVTATLKTQEVRGVFHRSGNSKNYTATLDGRKVYFDPNVFGAGVSSEAGLIPNDSSISADVVDIKTMAGTLPFLARAENNGVVYFAYSSDALRSSWNVATFLYSGIGAMVVGAICFMLGLTELPQRPSGKGAGPTAAS